jgi:hypothetical protein
MSSGKKNIIIGVILGLIILLIGFVWGRSTIKDNIIVEYVKGETIRDSIFYPVPVGSEVPLSPELPLIRDTIQIPGETIVITQKVDTSRIIAEFITKNKYRETLFDSDTVGTLIVEADMQYNKLQKLGYDFTPVQKNVSFQKEKLITPFVFTSINSLGGFEIGGGFFYRDLGFDVRYLTTGGQTGIGIGFHIKF